MLKVSLPAGLVAISTFAEQKVLGLFHWFIIDSSVEFAMSIVLLDLAIYWQHRIFHEVNVFWKLHRVHHSDIDLDATSALRFHPIEMIFSMFYKVILVLILGLSVESILVFEIILSSMAIFNHSNLYLPIWLERGLRFFIVTPQMHIIHHSIDQTESDTNYGFNLSIWDKVFGTYTSEFKSSGTIGNSKFRSIKDHSIIHLLKQPFL